MCCNIILIASGDPTSPSASQLTKVARHRPRILPNRKQNEIQNRENRRPGVPQRSDEKQRWKKNDLGGKWVPRWRPKSTIKKIKVV